MRNRKTSRNRRSANEWAKLVKAWERSGKSAAAFAASLGVKPDTLTWWRWKLSRRPKSGGGVSVTRRKRRQAREARASPRLVAVELQTPAGDLAPQRAVAWEIESARGEVLRASTVIAPGDLDRVLTAMTTQQPRR